MAKNGQKVGRNAKTGRFTVTRDEEVRGGEGWVISGPKGKSRTVITTPSSGATLDKLTVKHSKPLRRLAKK